MIENRYIRTALAALAVGAAVTIGSGVAAATPLTPANTAAPATATTDTGSTAESILNGLAGTISGIEHDTGSNTAVANALAAPGSSSLSGGQILPDLVCFVFGAESYAGPGALQPGCIPPPIA